ncbi:MULTISPECIES: nucleotidyl transferase AbiEii/AbiGii toxin family protein [unclassified Treponema]|uniref:IS256 family transposase n=1 Tax=unclassified Treponema TaxID=2638727 RepID=UPI0020A2FE12|nr:MULTISPECIES: nucleotidyl transferase AbiEii/AbiGii toxin family protein [unclassified Treponema]UTC66970.1 transposase [Treponema sp. OMZ 789]UTC69699.1 transposase [Treponema sp. OMZ 790]UTC72413.1 transposase [Treponema sp. OMZ 791]
MFEYKKISKNELEQVIRNASQKMGVNEVIIEKDYWVCFVLNYLFSKCKWKDNLTFKGGTSLSKCFSLIQRFSEDIDLILDWRVIGYKFGEPWKERSNTKQDKFNKISNQKTAEFLKNEFVPQMEDDFRNMLDEEFRISIDNEDSQTILFKYSKVFNSSYLTQAVRLEIGTLAAWTPSSIVGIIPDLQKNYPMLFEGERIGVRTVLPEIKNRGTEDILIACMDGLTGFPEAVKAVFADTHIQHCIVHMVRSSTKFVSYKDLKDVCKDLKEIYSAINEKSGAEALEDFGKKWDDKYPMIKAAWQRNWNELVEFFNYPEEIRKAIYTTNAIESLNSSLRKVTRNKPSFPDDDSIYKAMYLAIRNASKRWTMPIKNWGIAVNQFAILFDKRVPF